MSTTVSPFPTTLADLEFQGQALRNLYKTLRNLRKSTLSIPNRLRSIVSDAGFVEHLHASLVQRDHQPHRSSWPLIANERCGSWYIPPALESGSAYFKSTDGHYGQWDFSMRRLNLTVLELLGKHAGAVLVDSTRRGKEFPDALRRTVPIWVAVWNRALFPELCEGVTSDWMAGRFQNSGLEASEVVQIERRLEEFVKSLRSLRLDLDELREKVKKPIRCVWVSNTAHESDCIAELGEAIGRIRKHHVCNILVLCSASRRVAGAEMSEDGYIQGAGDDSESWSQGLTAQLFWKHLDELLSTSEDQLPELIEQLVKGADHQGQTQRPVLITPTENLFIGNKGASESTSASANTSDIVVSCGIAADIAEMPANQIHLGCRTGKLGSRDLRLKLKNLVDMVRTKLIVEPALKIFVMCNDGRDLSVGVVVTLLCLFYAETGEVDVKTSRLAHASESASLDKQFIKRRLAWVTSSKPDANPSRSTLQAINSFLMDRPD